MPRKRRSEGRAAAPTRTRILAMRVLERVQRAGAYADVLLHDTLARSDLGAPDRAFATELVYGTLRWRGRLDFLISAVSTGTWRSSSRWSPRRSAWARTRS